MTYVVLGCVLLHVLQASTVAYFMVNEVKDALEKVLGVVS